MFLYTTTWCVVTTAVLEYGYYKLHLEQVYIVEWRRRRKTTVCICCHKTEHMVYSDTIKLKFQRLTKDIIYFHDTHYGLSCIPWTLLLPTHSEKEASFPSVPFVWVNNSLTDSISSSLSTLYSHYLRLFMTMLVGLAACINLSFPSFRVTFFP